MVSASPGKVQNERPEIRIARTCNCGCSEFELQGGRYGDAVAAPHRPLPLDAAVGEGAASNGPTPFIAAAGAGAAPKRPTPLAAVLTALWCLAFSESTFDGTFAGAFLEEELDAATAAA